MMMKKLSEDHYIICDDSEIDYDSEPYLLIKDDYETYIHKHKGDNKPTTEHYKITHSNIPKGMMLMEGIERLSLQEAKELIGEVDVEKKAEELTKHLTFPNERKEGIIIGYNQALEDNKEKKYTEENLKYMFECGRNYQNNAEITFKVSMEYIQPKTEWEVEFVDGKLKLKQ